MKQTPVRERITRMQAKPKLRLSALLRSEITKVGSPHRLAELINEKNKQEGLICRVNRRMLVRIRDRPESVGLTLDTLTALNAYFKDRGEGLQDRPILEKRGVLEGLVEAEQLVFMLGAKPRPEERRTDMSWWDARSLADLLLSVSKLDLHREFDLVDVMWQWPTHARALASQEWHRFLAKDSASVVSIGAPLAALSSEVMLANMFGVKPFATANSYVRAPLPFYFVWRPESVANFRSAFALGWRELQEDFADLAGKVKSNRTASFILDGRRHDVPAKAKSWTMYGIIAAQRRAAGNVWVVISGLAGPATFASATMLKRITAELPFSPGENSKVLWVPVKVKIAAASGGGVLGDGREVVGAEFDGEPRLWPVPS